MPFSDVDPAPDLHGHTHSVTLESVGPPTSTVVRDVLACVALALFIVMQTAVITYVVLLGLAGKIGWP